MSSFLRPAPVRPAFAFALTLAISVSACGGFGSATLRRTVGGESRPGIFVSPFSYEHFIRGELAALRGDLRQAAVEYRLARAGPEDDPLLIARLADVVDRLGREREALALLEQGDDIDPNEESIWLTRGRIHERHGRMDEAAEAFGRAASAAPSSEAGPLALAALMRERGEAASADAVLARYLARADGAGAARARLALAIEHGDPLAAAQAVRSLLSAAPVRAEEVRAAATTALEGNQPELALRLLAALPDERADRSLRLRAMLEARDHERAEGLLASWMPGGPRELVEVAEGYLAIGRPERALELGQIAMSSEGGAFARLVIGRALRAAGRLGEAAQILASIEPASRGWIDAVIELGATMRDAGQPAVAAEVLDRARAHRDAPRLRIALAEARSEVGRGDAALAALEGDDPRLRAARARLLDRLGRHREAIAAYRELSADDDAIPEPDRLRAQAEQLLGPERERAMALLRELVENAPEDALASARLAVLSAQSRASSR